MSPYSGPTRTAVRNIGPPPRSAARRASPDDRAGWSIPDMGGLDTRGAAASPGRRRSELQQLADLNVAVGWQPVGPLEGGIHAKKIHDVEGLNLPLTLGERPTLHRPVERVPSYRGLNQTSAGRGRSECPVEHERAVGLHLLVEIGS